MPGTPGKTEGKKGVDSPGQQALRFVAGGEAASAEHWERWSGAKKGIGQREEKGREAKEQRVRGRDPLGLETTARKKEVVLEARR